MIASIRGRVIEKDRFSVVVETGGVGYRILMREDDLNTIQQDTEVFIWVHTWVREDTFDLYGFLNKEEKEFFSLLISISGIGAKTALNILSVAPPETLIQAIITKNTSYLTKVSGIGRKNAEKIILELKDKIQHLATPLETLKHDEETLLALRALGYRTQEIREVLQKIPKNIEGAQNRIKEALRLLSKKP